MVVSLVAYFFWPTLYITHIHWIRCRRATFAKNNLFTSSAFQLVRHDWYYSRFVWRSLADGKNVIRKMLVATRHDWRRLGSGQSSLSKAWRGHLSNCRRPLRHDHRHARWSTPWDRSDPHVTQTDGHSIIVSIRWCSVIIRHFGHFSTEGLQRASMLKGVVAKGHESWHFVCLSVRLTHCWSTPKRFEISKYLCLVAWKTR